MPPQLGSIASLIRNARTNKEAGQILHNFFNPRQAAKNLQKKGVRGDTILAHINPQEALMLKRMGGEGSINKSTGLKQYPPNESGLQLPSRKIFKTPLNSLNNMKRMSQNLRLRSPVEKAVSEGSDNSADNWSWHEVEDINPNYQFPYSSGCAHSTLLSVMQKKNLLGKDMDLDNFDKYQNNLFRSIPKGHPRRSLMDKYIDQKTQYKRLQKAMWQKDKNVRVKAFDPKNPFKRKISGFPMEEALMLHGLDYRKTFNPTPLDIHNAIRDGFIPLLSHTPENENFNNPSDYKHSMLMRWSERNKDPESDIAYRLRAMNPAKIPMKFNVMKKSPNTLVNGHTNDNYTHLDGRKYTQSFLDNFVPSEGDPVFDPGDSIATLFSVR